VIVPPDLPKAIIDPLIGVFRASLVRYREQGGDPFGSVGIFDFRESGDGDSDEIGVVVPRDIAKALAHDDKLGGILGKLLQLVVGENCQPGLCRVVAVVPHEGTLYGLTLWISLESIFVPTPFTMVKGGSC